jgi:type II secretory pathway pseudopilin PulG
MRHARAFTLIELCACLALLALAGTIVSVRALRTDDSAARRADIATFRLADRAARAAARSHDCGATLTIDHRHVINLKSDGAPERLFPIRGGDLSILPAVLHYDSAGHCEDVTIVRNPKAIVVAHMSGITGDLAEARR